jgi:hypothetical protein
MSRQTPNVDLTVWDSNSDEFNPTELADNWDKLDAALDTSGSFFPADQVEIRSDLPVTGLFDGRLVYLTATASGFPAKTMVVYNGTIWKTVGPIEEFTSIPGAGNYVGRLIVLLSPDGGFSARDLLVNADGADSWTKVGGIARGNSLPSSPSSGDVFLLTGPAGGFDAFTIVVYTGTAWTHVDKRGIETGTALPSGPYKGQVFVLTANASGFRDLDMVQYTGSSWRLLTGPLYVTLTEFLTIGSVPTGYEVYLRIDDSEGVFWHLRYNDASTSPYKWERVGSNKIVMEVETDEAPAVANTWTDLTTVGPIWTVPTGIGGDFFIDARATQTPNTRVKWKIGVSLNNATPVKKAISHHHGQDSDKHTLVLNNYKVNGLDSGETVKMKYYVGKVEPLIGDRVMAVEPKRIGIL